MTPGARHLPKTPTRRLAPAGADSPERRVRCIVNAALFGGLDADEAADRLRERMEGAIFPRGLTWIGAKMPCFGSTMTLIGKMTEKVAPFLFRW